MLKAGKKSLKTIHGLTARHGKKSGRVGGPQDGKISSKGSDNCTMCLFEKH